MRIEMSSELRWDFDNLADYHWDLVNNIINPKIVNNLYGGNINFVFILLICNSGTSKFKIRKRVYPDKVEGNWIAIDCKLEISKAMLLTDKELRIYVLTELKLTVQSLITMKKKVEEFNFEQFISDICLILDEQIKLEENM